MIEISDERLHPVVQGAQLERLCTGAIWSEGPVWLHEDDSVLWSDIPNNRILRWSAADGMTVWRSGVEFTNGHTRDRNGDLLHCSHGLRAIVRTPCLQGGIHATTPDEVVVNAYQGRRLNSPNDIVVRASDGSIWFTDPPYGILSNREGYQAASEQPHNHVFCLAPDGALHAATHWLQEPNGLAFSPDERLLYVSDTSGALREGGHHHIVAFDVAGFTLRNPRVFAVVSPGLPDGFRLDAQGWLYTSSADGVHVYHPDGTRLGRIAVPEKVGNLTFGGLTRSQLFIAASTSLYRITLNTQGLQKP